MTYEIYRYIFYGGAILSAIMLVVSIILFIAFKIPNVISDLTGRTARKAIENIRNQNESSGNKTYRSSLVNQERGKLTDKISPSGQLLKEPSTALHGAMYTEKIGTQPLGTELSEGIESNLTEENGATTLLEAQTTNETTVLSYDEPLQQATFEIEYEITYIHSNEIIA